ncbi:Protein of unknown function [Gryllus bimaculatus]|nr:Protein of unknown function [Gryllus bimaculatus]
MKVIPGCLRRTQLAQTRKNRSSMPKREFALKYEVGRILRYVNKSPVSPEICRNT